MQPAEQVGGTGRTCHPPRDVLDALVTLIFLSITALFVWNGEFLDYKWINHDVANALYIGKRMLQGDRLYIDWYYYVTPAIVLLSAGVCWVAGFLRITPITTIHLLPILGAILGLFSIRHAFPGRSGKRAVLILAYLGVLVHVGLWSGDFAQREHLFALLFVPYLLWCISERPSSPTLLALAFCLGWAAMIKPHFLLVILVVEAFYARDRVDRRTVWASLLVGSMLSFGLLLLHSPSSFAAFFTAVIPFHFSGDYSAYNVPMGFFLISKYHRVLLILGAILLASCAYGYIRGVVPRRMAAAVVAVGLTLYLSILHQHKFFLYHFIPYIAVSYVFAVFLAWEIRGSIKANSLRAAAGVVIVLVPLFFIGRGFHSMTTLLTRGPTHHSRPVLPLLKDQELVMVMSPMVEGEIFAHTFTRDLEVMGPWSPNVTVSSILRIEDFAERSLALREYFEPLKKKIRSEQPGLVLFSPFRDTLGGLTMHQIFVEGYRLFPIPGYRLWKRTPNGWVIYERIARSD